MIGGGGGSGAYIIQTFDLSNTNDNTITIRTGKGGAPGSNGGQTTISIGGVTMIASGGFGGSTIGQGGSGGQVNLTSPFAKGNAGANGSSTTGQGGTLTQQITNGSGGNGGYATIGSSGSDGYAYAIVFSLA
jgi:hypothetical protein